MPVEADDAALLADMKQREIHLKNRQRATDAIHYEVRRYRTVVSTLTGVFGAALGAGVFYIVNNTLPDRPGTWRLLLIDVVLGAVLGVQAGHALMRTRWGKARIAEKELLLYTKYASELHAGRRWLQFYYGEENISAYASQILYFIEAEKRFDTVEEALKFAKEHRRANDPYAERARSRFDKVAAESSVLVVSSTDDKGRPTSRIMRFVKSTTPGVWYVTTAPEGHKVHEFEQGRVALITMPTEAGELITTNRVRIRRAAVDFSEIVHLYEDQIPGFVDRLTEADRASELVYELALESAKINSWTEYDVIEFAAPDSPATA